MTQCNAFIAPSFAIGGDWPDEGERNDLRRALVHRHGAFDYRWRLDTTYYGRDGRGSWSTTANGRAVTLRGAIHKARRAFVAALPGTDRP